MSIGESLLHNPDFRYRTSATKRGHLPPIVRYSHNRVEAEAHAKTLRAKYPDLEIDVVQQVGVVMGHPIRWRMNEDGKMEVVATKSANIATPSASEPPA